MASESEARKSTPIEIGTFMLTVILVVGGGAKFFWFDLPKFLLDQRARRIEVEKMESESISMDGRIFASSIVLGEDQLPVCPVVVEFTNQGNAEVQIKDIEFRVFTSPIQEAIKVEPFDMWEGLKFREKGALNRPKGKHSVRVGVIDMTSESWTERASLKRLPTTAILPAGQTHKETFHLLAPRGSMNFLTKVEVSAHTEKMTHKWTGFSDPQLYGPASVFEAPPPADVPAVGQ